MSDMYEEMLRQLAKVAAKAPDELGLSPPPAVPPSGAGGGKPHVVKSYELVKGNGAFIETSDGTMFYADLVRRGNNVAMLVMRNGMVEALTEEYRIVDNEKMYILTIPETAQTLAPYVDEVNVPDLEPSLKDIYVQVRDAVHENIAFVQDVYYKLVPAWIVATHFIGVFDSFPELAIIGQAGSGKTTLLALISKLARRSLMISDVTQAAFFRMVDALRPTMLVDEVEVAPKEVRLMMRLAYKKGNAIPRVDFVMGVRTIVLFDTYAPVAYASTMYPDDEALVSRSIIIRMVRRPKVAKIAAKARDYEAIRLELAAAAFKLYHKVRVNYVDTLSFLANHGVSHRDAEIYAPVVTILRMVGESVADVIDHIRLEREEKDAASDLDLAIANAILSSAAQVQGDFAYYEWQPLLRKILRDFPWLVEKQDEVVRRLLVIGARVVYGGKVMLRVHKDQLALLAAMLGMQNPLAAKAKHGKP